ncbi:MAG TPA: hypothetical protein VK689_04670 [Armatimonadota bacterium]|nr:hypothetical protein [Armatimonadota bacterium]
MSAARKPGDRESRGVASETERHLGIEIRFVKGLLADLPPDADVSRLRTAMRIRGLEAELVGLTHSAARKLPAH